MFRFEVNEAVVVQQQRVLEAALASNPRTAERLRGLIRKMVLEARAEVVGSLRFGNGDPRGTRQAVRSVVYRRVFGANLNILPPRRGHGAASVEPKKMSSGRGGNRRSRSDKTVRMMSYAPQDRGMILRWLDAGTAGRHVGFKYNDRRVHDRWNSAPNTGNRGSIAARNFFRVAGDRALQRMADRIAVEIEGALTAI